MTQHITIRVNVTAQDISQGERNHPDRCPIALALARVVGPGWEVQEDRLHRNGTLVDWMLPVDAQRWIECYDKGGSVSPFQLSVNMDT
jgi:hypothetical protein